MRRKLLLPVCVLQVSFGLALIVGPGQTLHHELHKRDLLMFRECCCVGDPAHNDCGWNDHFGHSWSRHGRIVIAGTAWAGLWSLVVGFLAMAQSRRSASGSPGCIRCGYDLQGTLPYGISKCPECGALNKS